MSAATEHTTTPPASVKRKSKATELVDIALELYRLAQDEEGRPFAVALPGQGPNIARSIDRANLGEELAALYYARHGTAVGASPITDALGTLRGRARKHEREALALRVAKHSTGITIDLGTPDGKAIVVEPGAWYLVDSSPIVFRRTALTKQLPIPTRGGSIDGIRNLLNVSATAWPVFLGWIVSTLVLHDGSRPILFLTGEQGTGKTTAAKIIAQLLDPTPAPVRAAPKDVESWVVSATASVVVALDNLSSVPDWLADALCRASTGEGLVRRQLYTDSEVAVNTFRRAVILTTIDAGALRGDLGERLVPVELDVIHSDQRRTDRELDAAFNAEHPAAFGAVLDLVAQVLTEMSGVFLADMPRMADFARVLAALDRATGHHALDTYLETLDDVAREVFESDPLAVALKNIALTPAGFKGTASELLTRLTRPDTGGAWPKTAKGLSGAIRRLAPALRAMGVSAETGKANGARFIRLSPFDRDARDARAHSPSVKCEQEEGSTQAEDTKLEDGAPSNASLASLPEHNDQPDEEEPF